MHKSTKITIFLDLVSRKLTSEIGVPFCPATSMVMKSKSREVTIPERFLINFQRSFGIFMEGTGRMTDFQAFQSKIDLNGLNEPNPMKNN